MSNNTLKVCVNYGCGFTAPTDWLNYDASPTLKFERIPILGSLYTRNEKRFPKNIIYGDISKGLPLNDDYVDLVFCSHILEHLSLQGFKLALINTYKIMRSGGVFRLVVPDLAIIVKEYIDSKKNDAAITFIKDTLLGREVREISLMSKLVSLFSNNHHLWMWDFNSLKLELERAGFRHIRRCYFGDSNELKFSAVEDKSRYVGSLGIECQK